MITVADARNAIEHGRIVVYLDGKPNVAATDALAGMLDEVGRLPAGEASSVWIEADRFATGALKGTDNRDAREALDHAASAVEWEADSLYIERSVKGWIRAIARWLRDNEARVIAEISQPERPAQGDGSS